ncbi:MAG: tryptophan synthase subunit alpha, partial [Candidatus Micrarchaeota archaeon]
MKLEDAFGKGGASFMPYICCGDPNPEFTIRAVKALAAAGADAIELGIPFSDPIADGMSIQAASARALRSGMTPSKALDVLREIREQTQIPVIVMTYYNIILANGGEGFLRRARDAGADALIVPDVPLEESVALQAACREAGLTLIRMVSLSCSDARLMKISEKAEGFIYAVGALGTTGARDNLGKEAAELVQKMKGITGLPVAVGFGISKPAHAAALVEAGADGIIVGSAIADIYSGHIGKDGVIDEGGALAELE